LVNALTLQAIKIRASALTLTALKSGCIFFAGGYDPLLAPFGVR
jgi:hypothetical protein